MKFETRCWRLPELNAERAKEEVRSGAVAAKKGGKKAAGLAQSTIRALAFRPRTNGDAIVKYAKAVWEAFPDMTLELISVSEIGSGQVAHQWLLRGTNSGPLMDGSAATGRTLTLPGNDVIQVEGDKIRSVEVNYDRQAVDDQLGGTPA
jgi:predicted ester cyclase